MEGSAPNMTEPRIVAAPKRNSYPQRNWKGHIKAPWAGSQDSLVPTFGVFCLLTFCFVIVSHKLPLAQVSAAGAIIAAALRGKQFEIPWFYRWYLAYIAIGVIGLATTRYWGVVTAELFEVIKIALIGIAACNILSNSRSCRTFAIWYLALFALYPVRGTLYNYITGNTYFGRSAWNFFFANPNDLAIACFLPLGLCAYLIFVEKGKWLKRAAWSGVVVIPSVQFLTESRAAVLSLAAATIYFAMQTKQRMRTLLIISTVCALAIAATPSGVWHRVAGLANLSTGDMSQVDPEQSAAGRATLMRLAWGVALENPVTGIGIGAYSYENERITRGNLAVGAQERTFRDAHSTYIRTAAETGMIGGLCILLTILGSIAFCRKSRRAILQKDESSRWAMGVLALESSMVAYALGAIVNSAENSMYFTLQFVIPWAIASVAVRRVCQDQAVNEAAASQFAERNEVP